jgi:hypothetical protein
MATGRLTRLQNFCSMTNRTPCIYEQKLSLDCGFLRHRRQPSEWQFKRGSACRWASYATGWRGVRCGQAGEQSLRGLVKVSRSGQPRAKLISDAETLCQRARRGKLLRAAVKYSFEARMPRVNWRRPPLIIYARSSMADRVGRNWIYKAILWKTAKALAERPSQQQAHSDTHSSSSDIGWIKSRRVNYAREPESGRPRFKLSSQRL